MSIQGVIESCLHVGDLDLSRRFYESVCGFETMLADDRFCAMSVAGRQAFLLFKKGVTSEPVTIPGGVIPPHDGQGRLHVAFAIGAGEFDEWKARVAGHTPIESIVEWPLGGRSIYFRDPDSHCIELVTPGVWPIY